MNTMMVSMVLLWIVNVAVIIAVLALARQVGLLLERITPVGALTMDHGPKVGEAAPAFSLPLLNGGRTLIGAATGRSQLVFFLSPTCPVCKKLLPVLRSLSRHESAIVDVVLASDGDAAEHQRFYQREKVEPFPYQQAALCGGDRSGRTDQRQGAGQQSRTAGEPAGRTGNGSRVRAGVPGKDAQARCRGC